jgi:hypothetical protein
MALSDSYCMKAVVEASTGVDPMMQGFPALQNMASQ